MGNPYGWDGADRGAPTTPPNPYDQFRVQPAQQQAPQQPAPQMQSTLQASPQVMLHPGAHHDGGGQPRPGARAPRRRRTGLPRGFWIGLGAFALVLLLPASIVVAEFIARGSVVDRLESVAASIETTYGGEPVEGGYAVDFGSLALLGQITGEYGTVTFKGDRQTVGGANMYTQIEAHGFPADASGAIDRVDVLTIASAEAAAHWVGGLTGGGAQLIQPEVTLRDGSMLVVFERGDAAKTRYEHEIELRIEGGHLIAEPVSNVMYVRGDRHDFGARGPVQIDLCHDLDGVEVTAEHVSISPIGLELSWSVTGAGPTVDDLGLAASCV